MNRQGLESLIEFALHLRGRLDGTHNQANVARDALELSGIAKRLHYLDGQGSNGAIEPAAYDRKQASAMYQAETILKPYGYRPEHWRGHGLLLASPGHPSRATDLAVPY